MKVTRKEACMAIITISRELGSGGGLISQMIVNSLNYRLADKELIGNIMLKYGVLSFNEVYDSIHSVWSRLDSSDQQVVKLLNETIKAFAKRDNTLIIGRGGFYVLKDYQNVLNVLLRAPLDYRIRNAMQTEQIDDILEAEKAVKHNDEVRQSFLQTFYGVDPNDARYFNLVIDTSRIPLNLAGRWIMEAAKAIDARSIRPEFSSLQAEVDAVLLNTIEEVLAKPG